MKWQPIETAPRDREVLLFFPKWGWVRGSFDEDRFARKPAPYWRHDRIRLHGVSATRANPPTYWMPLPDPPAGAE